MFAGFLEVWDILPEGNGKTTLIAALALYHIRHKVGARVPVAASARDQAEILYAQAEGLVDRTEDENPSFRGVFKCLEGYRRIRCDAMRSRIQIFAADERTGDGVIPTLCIVEELHRHRNLGLLRTWRGKLRKRKGQIVVISTSGEPGSEFEKTRKRIRESAPDVRRRGRCYTRAARFPQEVLHEYAVPAGMDTSDLRLVKEANPAPSVTLETLAEDYASSTMTDEHWRRFKCNQATRLTGSAISEAEWLRAQTSDAIPAGQPIDLGLDAGWKWDTFAMVPLWTRPVEVRPGVTEVVPLRILGPAAILTPPRTGDSLHPDEVKRELRAIHKRNPIRRVAMDMTHAEEIAHFIKDELHAEVADHSQGNAQQVIDYDRFMKGLRTGVLRHTGDAGLMRHAMNAVMKEAGDGSKRFARASENRDSGDNDQRVIDALVAAAMVYSEAEAPTPTSGVAGWGVAG